MIRKFKTFYSLFCITLTLSVCLTACGSENPNSESQVSSMKSETTQSTVSNTTSSEQIKDKRYDIHPLYADELEDTRNKLKEVQTADGFSYLILSDTHIDYTGGKKPERTVVEREVAALIEIANTTDVDCVILGGDMIHGTSSYKDSMDDLQYFVDMFSKCKVPVYAIHGNHDTNMYHGNPCHIKYPIDQKDWTTKFVDPLSRNTVIHDSTDPNSTYYYVDFPEKKTRIIAIDPYNHPMTSSDGEHCDYYTETWNHIDEKQMDWLASVALSTEKEGWQYIIASHGPLNGSETIGRCEEVEALISAFNNGGKYTLADGTVIDYSTCTSYAPIYTCGHTHVNAFNYSDSAKILGIVTGSGKLSYYEQNSEYYANRYKADWVYHPVREFDTITEATFDAINISPSGQVMRIAFGAGDDNNLDISAYKK